MSEGSPGPERTRPSPSDFFHAHLVPQVLSVLISDDRHEGKPPIPALLDLLVAAMVSGDRVLMLRLGAEIRRLHVPAAVVVDTYLPAAVDRVGARWHDDEIDILTATIAFARMQTLLRDLGRGWHADEMAGSGGAVLMLVPDSDQHTLGALLATTQLRRRGVSVTVSLSASPLELDRLLAKARFDAVFISVANVSSLDSVAKLVKIAKRPGGAVLPVIVGGAVPVALSGVRDVSGADLVTRDIAEALAFVGLGARTEAAR